MGSTNCLIGYENEDRKYVATRVHYDGYPSGIMPFVEHASIDEVTFWITSAWLKGGIKHLSKERKPIYWSESLTTPDPRYCVTDKFDSELFRRHHVPFAYMKDLRGEWLILALSFPK